MEKSKGKLSRNFKRAVAGVAIVGVVYWAAGPNVDFNNSRTYEPNDVQREFIRLAAEQNYYLAFGDTDHRKPEIQTFALSQKTVSALAEAGKQNYFLEQSPDVQPYFDALRKGPSPYQYHLADGNMWLCSADQKNMLNSTFESSAQANPSIRFVGADNRQVSDPFATMTRGEKAQTIAFFLLPITAYNAAYGCVDTKALIPGSIILHLTGVDKKLSDDITDDRATAQNMLNHAGPSAILYGAGHFQEVGSKGADTSMRGILAQDGRSIAVFEVYRDAEQRGDNAAMFEGRDVKKPDAVLYAIPPAGNPDGIEIVNPAFQTVYEQAKKNAQERSVPGPFIHPSRIPGV